MLGNRRRIAESPALRAGPGPAVLRPVAPRLRVGPAESQVGLELAELGQALDLHRRDHRPLHQAAARERAGELGLAAGELQVAGRSPPGRGAVRRRGRGPRPGPSACGSSRRGGRGRRPACPPWHAGRRARSCRRRARLQRRSSRRCCRSRSRRRPCGRCAGRRGCLGRLLLALCRLGGHGGPPAMSGRDTLGESARGLGWSWRSTALGAMPAAASDGRAPLGLKPQPD